MIKKINGRGYKIQTKISLDRSVPRASSGCQKNVLLFEGFFL